METIDNLKVKLAERDRQLAERDRQLAERDRQLAERDRMMYMLSASNPVTLHNVVQSGNIAYLNILIGKNTVQQNINGATNKINVSSGSSSSSSSSSLGGCNPNGIVSGNIGEMNIDFQGMSLIHLVQFFSDKKEALGLQRTIFTVDQLIEAIQFYLTEPRTMKIEQYLRQLHLDVIQLLKQWKEGTLDDSVTMRSLDQKPLQLLSDMCNAIVQQTEEFFQCKNTVLTKRIENALEKQKLVDYTQWADQVSSMKNQMDSSLRNDSLIFAKDSMMKIGSSDANFSKKSILEFVIHTDGGGDCAFHAALGEWDGSAVKCSNVSNIRKQLANIINDIQDDSPMFPFVVSGIEAQLMSGEGFVTLRKQRRNFEIQNKQSIDAAWSELEQDLKKSKEIMDFILSGVKDKKALTELRHQFNHCLNLEQGKLYNWISLDKALNDKFIAFKNAFNQEFNLSAYILADRRNVLTEYANYIGKQGQWLLPLEFHLIAYAFDLNIKFYTYNPNEKICSGPENINPTGQKKVSVCFNGLNHFERVLDDNYYQKSVHQRNSSTSTSQSKAKKEISETGQQLSIKESRDFFDKTLVENLWLWWKNAKNEGNPLLTLLESNEYAIISKRLQSGLILGEEAKYAEKEIKQHLTIIMDLNYKPSNNDPLYSVYEYFHNGVSAVFKEKMTIGEIVFPEALPEINQNVLEKIIREWKQNVLNREVVLSIEHIVRQISKELILKADNHTIVSKKAVEELLTQYQTDRHRLKSDSEVQKLNEKLVFNQSQVLFLDTVLREIIIKAAPLNFQIKRVSERLFIDWKAKQLSAGELTFLDAELMRDWNDLLKQMQRKFDPMARSEELIGSMISTAASLQPRPVSVSAAQDALSTDVSEMSQSESVHIQGHYDHLGWLGSKALAEVKKLKAGLSNSDAVSAAAVPAPSNLERVSNFSDQEINFILVESGEGINNEMEKDKKPSMK